MGTAVFTVMEIIGTVAFAISGSLIAARYELDLFGVVLVGCVTAVCGGMLRDILLGQLPPAVFSAVRLIVFVIVKDTNIAFANHCLIAFYAICFLHFYVLFWVNVFY
ncbi:MAG: TRIC cation channel family protein [Clostridia bacterium]|nr:TRIC cation channel family protein [Clostridia bacterium]